MFSLAPLRYSKIHKDAGGPVARLEYSHEEVFGRRNVQAVAYLRDDLVPDFERPAGVLEAPDGAGSHTSVQVACHMAISEAIERWAVFFCRAEGQARGGSGVDASSNGFAAFPGVYRRQARRAALCESIERHCLISWWEGLLPHYALSDPFPGVRAIRIENPYTSHEVVVLWTEDAGRYAYSFGAAERLDRAIWRALVELHRTRKLVSGLVDSGLGRGDGSSLGHIYERRLMYFSGEAGVRKFIDRLESEVGSSSSSRAFDFIYDGPVLGEWDRYASVWRTIIRPPSPRYLSDEVDYFFW